MKNLIDAVELYLKTIETDYAILIKGDWGCGKTYFYKNVLTNKITELGYDPVYVSLFGIANSVELSRRLFLELNPKIGSLMKSKTGKAAELAKVIFGNLSLYGVGLSLDFDNLNLKNWISLKPNYLLCFDDLERTSFQISEVLGYINNIIEHDHCKVLLIANEDEISKEDSYWKFKEKIVGYSIEYIPNIENVFMTICESFKKDGNLCSFFVEHKAPILQMLQDRKLNNIRILKHALQSYRFIHDYLIGQKNTKPLNEFGVRLLLFTLAVSYAVKSGNDAMKEELKKIASTEDLRFKLHFSDEKTNNKSQLLKEFCERFYDSTQYEIFFSRSVLDFILNGFFHLELLGREINAELKEVEDPITRSIRTILYEWFNLDDDEFTSLSKNVLNFIREGKIHINLYPGMFSLFSHFSQQALIKEDTGSLVELFKEGASKAYESMLASYDGTQSLSVSNILVEGKPSEEYIEIKRLTEQYINGIEEKWFKKNVQDIFELLPKDIEGFSGRLLREKEHYWSKPVFKYYSMENLFEKLKQGNNRTRVNFRNLLYRRYRDIRGIQEVLSEDADSLRKLSELIKSYTREREQNLSTLLLKKIGDAAQECCEILSERPTQPKA